MVKRLTISLPDDVYKQVREEAFNTFTSISNIILGKIIGVTHLKVNKVVKGLPKIDKKFLDKGELDKPRGEIHGEDYV